MNLQGFIGNRCNVMIVISIVGSSKTGKTTTIEYLISRLTREGYRVGSVKHIHHDSFSMDTEGTDTWRHAHAGAMVTVAVAPKETVLIKKTSAHSKDIDRIIKLFENEKLDFVFIEGLHSLTARRKDIPKIITAREIDDLRDKMKGTVSILAITGIIAKKGIEKSEINVPIIDLDKEGDLLLKLVKEQLKLRNV